MTETNPPYRGTVPDDELSPYVPFRIALQYRYFLLFTVFVGGVIAAVTAPFDTYLYTSEATFLPTGGNERATGGAAAVAGQLGINVPRSSVEQSPQFYAELLLSRRILDQLLEDTFTVAANPQTGSAAQTGPLWSLLGVSGEVREIILHDGRDVLYEAVQSSEDEGIVRLAVTTAWPDLSQEMATRLIRLVETFNAETRRTSAAAETRFLERRLQETAASLRNAEERARAFLEANRQFNSSPQLVFEFERLQREVAMQQEIYLGLSEALALAQSAAVRDTPLITVVELPARPAYANSRRLIERGIVGLMLGFLTGLVFAFFREFFRGNPSRRDDEFHRFREAWQDTVRDLRINGRKRSRPRKSAP